jgi:Immunity protein 35
MIDRNAATAIARAHLAKISGGSPNRALLEEQTLERPCGWIFFCTSRRFLETGDYRDALAGNAPFIVDRDDGSVHTTGTGRPIEHYVAEYEQRRRSR